MKTINLVSAAVRAADVAVEVTQFNLRRRQLSKDMALGAGSKAAEGDSEDETEYDSAGSDCGASSYGGSVSDCSPSMGRASNLLTLSAARNMHKERTWNGTKTVWKQNVLERIDEMRKAMAN